MPAGKIALLAMMLSISVAGMAADDPLLGTWKLNVAKSKFDPGPPPKSAIRTCSQQGNAIKMTQQEIDGQGKPTPWEYTASFDGKDFPVKGDPGRDTVSWKRLDPHTIEGASKKAGKTTNTFRWIISQDGKTLTATVKGVNAQGQAVNNFTVFDKQ